MIQLHTLPAPAPIPTRYMTESLRAILALYEGVLDSYCAQNEAFESVNRTDLEWAIIDAYEKGIEFKYGKDVTFGVALARELIRSAGLVIQNNRYNTELNPFFFIDARIGLRIDRACQETHRLFRQSWLFGLFYSHKRSYGKYRSIITQIITTWDDIHTEYQTVE